MKSEELKILNQIAQRALIILNQMIYTANHRGDQEKGDPKIGGHCSASVSALHILGALHLAVKTGYDYIANKPHASPADHAYNYLLGLLLDQNLNPLSPGQSEQAMRGLRAFPQQGEFTFQSYHSVYDPDHHHFLPSGTVGIPPVVAGYLALAYRSARLQGYKAPTAHFWAVIGDSEFREGSLMEALPDLAERTAGNLTWILDYNRQSLDGHRLINDQVIEGSDALRIENTLSANGWRVIQLRHGSLRQKLFQKPGGEDFKNFLENELKDHEFQALFPKPERELKEILSKHKKLKTFLKDISAEELKRAFVDLGGHDFSVLIPALKKSKEDPARPCFIIAHTIKGWGLKMAGLSGNHSYLISREELDTLRRAEGAGEGEFPLFPPESAPARFLKKRKATLYREIKDQHKIKKENQATFQKLASIDDFPKTLAVDFHKMSYPHTQWFLGQVMAKLARVANAKDSNALKPEERALQTPARLVYSLSPDVGTSTNLGFAMNDKVFGPHWITEEQLKKDLEDKKSPGLISREESQNRFIRFEITEANAISCMAAYGKMNDLLGVPILPLMTIYDFFIKRALDQYFYALYWECGFILCGTPSGVTLSPEGAQHGWKSDFQIPNQITWEPFFIQEMDWIFAEALQRHFTGNNKGRTGVLLRAVTKGVDQKLFLECLKTQKRFKLKQRQEMLLFPKNHSLPGACDESMEPCVPDGEIFSQIRHEILNGAYYLLNHEGYADYCEKENVVHIFTMGAPSAEGIKAVRTLLSMGIYANLIVVTSPDLLLSNPAFVNDYQHLRKGLNLQNTRAPVVSVHDGEPGLLDNIGSILGTYQETLAVRQHSRCGRPKDVYRYHGIDSNAVVRACLKALKHNAQKFF